MRRDFLANALPGDLRDGTGEFFDRVERRRVDFKIEAGGKPHGADHAQPVFFKALFRVADGADKAPLKIPPAFDQVDHPIFDRIVDHSIDRKITAQYIFLEAAVTHVARRAARPNRGRHDES